MSVTQTPSGTATEVYVVQFARPVAPDNWLTVADAGPFETDGEAWNWINDSVIPFEMRVVRRVTTDTVMARPLNI